MSDALLDFVNQEQLLDLGLTLYREDTESDHANNLINWYLAYTQPELFEDDQEEAYCEAIGKLVKTAFCSDLVALGFMTFDFKSNRYVPTALGLKLRDGLMDGWDDPEE